MLYELSYCGALNSNDIVCTHTYLNLFSYDHPHILAGQGTIGLEICEQVPDVDVVVVPAGGGGLIAGISCAIKNILPHVTVIVRFFFNMLLYCTGWFGFHCCEFGS